MTELYGKKNRPESLVTWVPWFADSMVTPAMGWSPDLSITRPCSWALALKAQNMIKSAQVVLIHKFYNNHTDCQQMRAMPLSEANGQECLPSLRRHYPGQVLRVLSQPWNDFLSTPGIWGQPVNPVTWHKDMGEKDVILCNIQWKLFVL